MLIFLFFRGGKKNYVRISNFRPQRGLLHLFVVARNIFRHF